MLQTFAVVTAEAASSSDIAMPGSGLSLSDIGAIVLITLILGTLFLIVRTAGFTNRNR